MKYFLKTDISIYFLSNALTHSYVQCKKHLSKTLMQKHLSKRNWIRNLFLTTTDINVVKNGFNVQFTFCWFYLLSVHDMKFLKWFKQQLEEYSFLHNEKKMISMTLTTHKLTHVRFLKMYQTKIFRSGIFPFCVALRYSFTWLVLFYCKTCKCYVIFIILNTE